MTGSNRGIGLALVEELVKNGALVYATCRKPSEKLTAAGVHKVIQGVDVTQAAAMETLVAGVDTPLDVIINNAGCVSHAAAALLPRPDGRRRRTARPGCAARSTALSASLLPARFLRGQGARRRHLCSRFVPTR